MFETIRAWVKRHPIWSAIIALVLLFILYRIVRPTPHDYEYVSETVTRGEVLRKVSASGVPPGSRVRVTALPCASNACANAAMWVDLPAPSMPSKLMNKPFIDLFVLLAGGYFPRWNWLTARLWASSVSLNTLLPSPRAPRLRQRPRACAHRASYQRWQRARGCRSRRTAW